MAQSILYCWGLLKHSPCPAVAAADTSSAVISVCEPYLLLALTCSCVLLHYVLLPCILLLCVLLPCVLLQSVFCHVFYFRVFLLFFVHHQSIQSPTSPAPRPRITLSPPLAAGVITTVWGSRLGRDGPSGRAGDSLCLLLPGARN